MTRLRVAILIALCLLAVCAPATAQSAGDATVSWTNRGLRAAVGDVQHVTEVLPRSDGSIWVTYYDGSNRTYLGVTTDGGTTWTSALLPGFSQVRVLLELPDGSVLFGGSSVGSQPLLQRLLSTSSAPSTLHWQACGTGSGSVGLPSAGVENVWDLLLDSDGAILAAVASSSGDPLANNTAVLRSVDTCATFVSLTPLPGLGALALARDTGGRLFAATQESSEHDDATAAGQARVFYSDDHGTTWTQSALITGANRIYDMAVMRNGTLLAGSGISGEFYRSTDRGVSWVRTTHVPAGTKLFGDPPVPTEFAATRVYAILELANGWVLVGTGNSTGDLYLTPDYGDTWFATGDTGSSIVSWALAQTSDGTVWIGTGSHGGDVWSGTITGGPAASANPSQLRFAVVRNATSGAITHATSAQDVTINFAGVRPSWVAAADAAWLSLSGGATSGTGTGTLRVQLNTAAVIGGGTRSALITVTTTDGSHLPTTIPVTLTVSADGATTAPTGQVDTPAQSATGLQGSIAMTGWVVDDVGIQHVRIYRQCLTGIDNPAACQDVLGSSVVFVGTASIISGARPDVEALFPSLPANNSAGWGFLILSNLLPNIPASNANGGGVGTFLLYAVATDAEGNQKLLGRSYIDTAPVPTTVTVSNDTIAKPFGAIDTPAQGATVSGTLNNFGWVLTPDSNTIADGTDILMPTTGTTIAVIVDGASVGTATYNLCRGTVGNPVPSGTLCDDDVSSIFRAAGVYRNLDAGRGAIGLRTINTATLTNGLHTIQWGVTDSVGRSEGIGSRYFTVLNSAGDASAPRDSGTSELRHSGTSGPRHSGTSELRDSGTSGLRNSGTSAPLFGRNGFDLARAFVVLGEIDGVPTIRVPEMGRVELQVPGAESVALVANGALREAPVGMTVDAATGTIAWSVGPGYLGTYRLSIEREDDQVLVDVTVAPMALVDEPLRMHLDRVDRAQVEGPGLSSSTWLGAGERFVRVEGWALDPQAETGSGIGAVHVWARKRGAGVQESRSAEVPEFRGAEVPESRGAEVPGSRSAEVPEFLGVADLGIARPDVAAAHGTQFDRAGFRFDGTLPDAGEWEITAYVWNIRTQRFEDARTIIVNVAVRTPAPPRDQMCSALRW